MAILCGLATQPNGLVLKEALAAQLWPEVPYHPLQHDPPIKVNVGRLRTLLEKSLLSIEAEAGGYVLRAPPELACVTRFVGSGLRASRLPGRFASL